MRNILFAVLAFAIPVSAFAAPPRLQNDIRVERSRPADMQRTEVRQVDRARANTAVRPERMPEAVKQMLKYDVCTSASARCD